MLELTIPRTDLWDERNQRFIPVKEQKLRLEHSLVSLSKWESKWCKVFLSKEQKTYEETIDYIRCMTLTQNVDPLVYRCITNSHIDAVNAYIEAPMTASTVIIYDNCASIKGRGISQQRKRFEIHLHKYYQLYGNDGYILFGDFSKFYDNIIHEIAKRELLKLFNDDEFIDWLLTLIFKGFQIDVSYMSDEEYEACMTDTFNKLEYRNIPKEKLTGEKWMEKSVNIGDQLSQVIGIYYPYPIDNYVKYVRQQKFYGRYMDDWYIMNPSKEELEELLENVCKIAAELGIHINRKKTRIVKISSKYKFLQIKYTLTDTGKVIKRINPDRVTAMRRKLKKLAVKVGHEEADYDNVENMFRGWMGGHYKLLSREQRKNLIQLYEDLFSKKITIVNKKLIVSDRSA